MSCCKNCCKDKYLVYNIILFFFSFDCISGCIKLIDDTSDFSNAILVPIRGYLSLLLEYSFDVFITSIIGCTLRQYYWFNVIYSYMILFVMFLSCFAMLMCFAMIISFKSESGSGTAEFSVLFTGIKKIFTTNPSNWILIQDNFECCGFGDLNELKTGANCKNSSHLLKNCITVIPNYLTNSYSTKFLCFCNKKKREQFADKQMSQRLIDIHSSNE
ncbi:hypothetical protein WA158_001601 [Blastocystis sp. Blastoise]